MLFVVKDLDGCFFHGSVHPLGLSVGPGMVGLRETVFDAMLKTHAIEDVRPEEASGWPLAVLRQIGEGHPVIGQDLVYL